MALVEKPREIHTVIARDRKLKGNNRGIFFTLPLKVAMHLGIERGDFLEIEIRKITKRKYEEPSD